MTKLLERYHTHESITHWHVSNEYGGYCYCENCGRAFRQWLKKKYETVQALNQAWNSSFWGHTYHSWEEIQPPTRRSDIFSSGKPVLGGAALDYRRFQSDSLLANYVMEKEVIRSYDTTRQITTNFMGSQKDLDYFKWAEELDIISWDNYPSLDTEASFTAFQHDLMRGLKGKPFMLMEQTPSQQNWQMYNALKQLGEMRMLSYQAIAHGANTIQFFQLKQSRNGAEKFHGAILSHSMSTKTRVFQEVSQLGSELADLPKSILESNSKAKVAIIFDWESYWGIENCIGPTTNLDYVASIQRYYHELYIRGISVDFISTNADFYPYKIVFAPSLYISTESLSTRLEEYVRQGGKFVTTTMSGLADENDTIHLGGYPGLWRELLGIHIDEIDSLPMNKTITLKSGQKIIGEATSLCDLIQTTTANILASYEDAIFYQGLAALTVNDYGKGKAFYEGTSLNEKGLSFFMDAVLDDFEVNAVYKSVEMTVRQTENEEFLFIINTSGQSQTIENPKKNAYDLLKKESSPDILQLAPFGVSILYKKK